MSNDKTTDTASQGLIDRAGDCLTTYAAQQDWRPFHEIVVALAAAKPLVAPAPDQDREAAIEAWRCSMLALRGPVIESCGGDPGDEVRASCLADNLTTSGLAFMRSAPPAPDSALREALVALACLGNGTTRGNSTGNCIAQAALDAAPESDVIADLKKQLAERDARVEWLEKWWPKWITEALDITEEEMGRSPLMAHGKVVQMRTRAEKAEAALADERSARAMDLARLAKAEAADGNAGLREFRKNIPGLHRFGGGKEWFGSIEEIKTAIDRILEAAPEDTKELLADAQVSSSEQPERDDGPLDRFVSGFQNGMDVSDRIDAAVVELCLRSGNVSEKARGAK